MHWSGSFLTLNHSDLRENVLVSLWECDKYLLLALNWCLHHFWGRLWSTCAGWNMCTLWLKLHCLSIWHSCLSCVFHLFPMTGMLVIPWQHTLIAEGFWICFLVCHIHYVLLIVNAMANDLLPKMAFRIRESSPTTWLKISDKIEIRYVIYYIYF